MSHKKLYRIYIDESGDHTYDLSGDLNKRFLALTGCVIEAEHYKSSFYPGMEELKKRYFHYDPDDPPIFHRKELIHKKGGFWPLQDQECQKRFDEDLLAFYATQEYRLITVVIDKKIHNERYGEFALHPYHYCLTVMLERYCGWLNFHGARGDVMAESRGGKEDTKLKQVFAETYNTGTRYHKAKFFQNMLTSKKLKIKSKTSNIAGLQLADLLAFPSKQEILIENSHIEKTGPFSQKVIDVIQTKYNRHVYNGTVKGYGKILL